MKGFLSFPWSELESITIVLGQEVGVLPIHNLYIGFLCRMDVELIEYHHLLLALVVERPLLGLTIRREVGAERRVAGLGELHPQFAHGFAEGWVEFSSRNLDA